MAQLHSLQSPADLVQQFVGVEQELRRRRRLGRLGLVSLLIWAAFQAVAITNGWATELNRVHWRDVQRGWWLYGSVVLLVSTAFLLRWSRYWLSSISEPFRFSVAVSAFKPTTPDLRDPCLSWLQYDLARLLTTRIGRLSLLQEDGLDAGSPLLTERHLHVGGTYLSRFEANNEQVLEVAPRVRCGPPGSVETPAQVVVLEWGSESRTTPGASREYYDRLAERVYWSVATQIYRELEREVQRKIDLLPSTFIKAKAHYIEAVDYAHSKTLDSYHEAQLLYERVVNYYEPTAVPKSVLGRRLFRFRRLIHSGDFALRRSAAVVIPRLGRTEVLVAAAQVGAARMALQTRTLGGLCGRRLDVSTRLRSPGYVRGAVQRLERLPADVPERTRYLFDAYVVLAFAFSEAGQLAGAKGALDQARVVGGDSCESDDLFQYVLALLTDNPDTQLTRYYRATQLARSPELPAFALALAREMAWRSRQLDRGSLRPVTDGYKEVLKYNPGNLGAWANAGYTEWLSAGLGGQRPDGSAGGDDCRDLARAAFMRGHEYRQFRPETFVAELDRGLARIAAESGDWIRAHSLYTESYLAGLALGHLYIGLHPEQDTLSYFYDGMNSHMLLRYRNYRDTVTALATTPLAEDVIDKSTATEIGMPKRVLAFVHYEYACACRRYFERWGDRRRLDEALESYKKSAAYGRYDKFLLPLYQRLDIECNELPCPEHQEDYDACHQTSLDIAEQLADAQPDWQEVQLRRARLLFYDATRRLREARPHWAERTETESPTTQFEQALDGSDGRGGSAHANDRLGAADEGIRRAVARAHEALEKVVLLHSGCGEEVRWSDLGSIKKASALALPDDPDETITEGILVWCQGWLDLIQEASEDRDRLRERWADLRSRLSATRVVLGKVDRLNPELLETARLIAIADRLTNRLSLLAPDEAAEPPVDGRSTRHRWPRRSLGGMKRRTGSEDECVHRGSNSEYRQLYRQNTWRGLRLDPADLGSLKGVLAQGPDEESGAAFNDTERRDIYNSALDTSDVSPWMALWIANECPELRNKALRRALERLDDPLLSDDLDLHLDVGLGLLSADMWEEALDVHLKAQGLALRPGRPGPETTDVEGRRNPDPDHRVDVVQSRLWAVQLILGKVPSQQASTVPAVQATGGSARRLEGAACVLRHGLAKVLPFSDRMATLCQATRLGIRGIDDARPIAGALWEAVERQWAAEETPLAALLPLAKVVSSAPSDVTVFASPPNTGTSPSWVWLVDSLSPPSLSSTTRARAAGVLCHSASSTAGTHPFSADYSLDLWEEPIRLLADEQLFPEGRETPAVQRALADDGDIARLRRIVEAETGIPVPGVHIRPIAVDQPRYYRIEFFEIARAEGLASYDRRPDSDSATRSGDADEVTRGMWSAGPDGDQPLQFMLTHLTDQLREDIALFFSLDLLQQRFDAWATTSGERNGRVSAARLDLPVLWTTLRRLLNHDAGTLLRLDAILSAFCRMAARERRSVRAVAAVVTSATREGQAG